MSTKIQWFIPCYFNTDDGSDKEIILDITESIKKAFSKKISEKKVEYGYNSNLKNFNSADFVSVEIRILPRFMSGYVNEKRLIQYIENNSKKIKTYFKVDPGYKHWNYTFGVVNIITILKKSNKSIPNRNKIKNFEFDSEFIGDYHKYSALKKEILSLFLSALHLTYPTQSIMGWRDSSLNDGILHIEALQKHFFTNLKTDTCMHHVLITKSRLTSLESNISLLAEIWDLNLWSLKRYLIAVKSNVVDMDSLLDLIYALEGLFDKNTSSDFIKIFCVFTLATTKKKAIEIKSILDAAFKFRNEIVHGAQHYNGNEKIKLNGKEKLSQELYWEMKFIVSQLIILSINKLFKVKGMKNLNFNMNDLVERIYKT